MVANRYSDDPEQLPTIPRVGQRGQQSDSASDPAPMTLRIVRTRPLAYSQRFSDTLQQWINGEWKDVEIVNQTYPLPDGQRNKGMG